MTTNKPLKIVSTAALLAALSACSGGSSSDVSAFDAVSAENADLYEKYADAEMTAAMPAEGTANYAGTMALAINETEALEADGSNALGFMDLNLTADFDAGEISGDLSNPEIQADKEVESLTGSADITNGTITGNEFFADVDGTFIENGTDEIALEATLEGNFYGEKADAIKGTMAGTWTHDGSDSEGLEGNFTAEEQ